MLKLSPADIFLDCRASSKTQALQIAASALEQAGYVKGGFLNALLSREKSVSTYLGAGIALPHCAKESIDLVVSTGYQVFQFPQGVSWGEGKVAFVVVAVAAKQDEHLDTIAAIADLLGDEAKTTLLAGARSKDEFIQRFEQP